MRVFLLMTVICTGANLVLAANRPPNVDEIVDYYINGPGAGLYEEDVLDDAQLDVPGLIQKYGYPVEVHDVVTEDGYILGVHRIPYGRYSNNQADPNKPVVIVMHGLLSSSADWVITRPGSALAYILADAGYDVWLGNARGTHYSRRHQTLNPDRNKAEFWDFSWEDIGSKDLPAMIDHALKVTGKSRLHYIGHSQGTTVFWMMGVNRPEYNDKIISMQALAPVAYLTNNENLLFNILAPHSASIKTAASLIGMHEFLPNSDLITTLGKVFCKDEALTQPICTNLLFIIAGGQEDMLNTTLLPIKLAHTPAGISAKQLVHYAQHIRKDFFRRYDYGRLSNLVRYGSSSPPNYDLSKVTAPVYLHYCEVDTFAHLSDLDRLYNELGRPVAKFKVNYPTFSHLDFMWGIQAKELVYDRAINLMKAVGDE